MLSTIFLGAALFVFVAPKSIYKQVSNQTKNKFGEILKSPVPSPSPSPTPRPLTFAEMNALYGPCVQLPTLMYHHIQTKEAAVAAKQTGLTVTTDVFKSQMEYLKSKGYSTLSIDSLVNFFDTGAAIPKHSILLTFDDAYQDFYTDAYPIIRDMGFRATMFVPTGLVQNPGYLTWDEISSMTGQVYFANHTWSHKSVLTQTSIMEDEISKANIQLNDHGLNSLKIFAYPYGPDNMPAENYLNSLGYKAAFTTKPGSVLCKQKRFDLPRIRIGNSSLSNYGF